MFELLKIKLFGHEPAAKITDKVLDRVIKREFGNRADEVRQKLHQVKSETPKGHNRICAAILKLADGNLNAIDHLIEVDLYDYRDILAPAEYSRYSKLGFGKVPKSKKKELYLADWKEYSAWLSKN